MQSNALRNILVLATVVMAVVSAMALAPFADADPAEGDFDEDLGEFWSYTIGFAYRGEGAESVTWDFGDGTEPVTAWSVVHEYPVSHTYEDPGIYYVTQTAENSQGGPSTAVYKVTVLGYPYIDFDSRGGSPVERIQMTSGGINAVPAEEPAEPTKAGFTFTGWYTTPECTELYDWTKPVTEGMTLYAGWTEATAGDDPGQGGTEGEGTDDSGTDWVAIGTIIAGIIIAIASLIAIAAVGSVGALGAVIGIVVVIAGVLKFTGVF